MMKIMERCWRGPDGIWGGREKKKLPDGTFNMQ